MSTDSPESVHVECQGHLLEVKASGAAAVGGGKRGKVVGFSAGSRVRLMKLLARLAPVTGQCLFLTLTYGAWFPDCNRARRDRATWEKRLKRRYPGASCVWRLELQRRGAPHFHLLIFGVPFIPVGWVRRTWGQVIGYDGPKKLQVRLERIHSWRGLMSYCSKYIAKVQTGYEMAELGGSPEALLDYSTYLTALFGRVWGVCDREALPWGELEQFDAPWGRWFWAMKRCARHVYKRIGAKAAGFALFREHPDQWIAMGFMIYVSS